MIEDASPIEKVEVFARIVFRGGRCFGKGNSSENMENLDVHSC